MCLLISCIGGETQGSTPPKVLLESRNVEFVYLPTPLPWISGLPRILFLLLSPTKVVMISFNLAWALLFRIEVAPTWIMIQVSLLLVFVLKS